MIRSLQFFAHDLRITWRDGSNRIFLLLPPLFILLLHTALPLAIETYPEITPYAPAILAWIVIQGGILFGFVTGFTLLDEKDNGLIAVYKISPIPFYRFLFLKILVPYAATVLYALVAFHFNPVFSLSGLPLVVAGLTFGLLTPVMALLIGALGRNKIEGLTYFKALDLLILIPLLAFFLPEGWEWSFSILPTFWSVSAIEQINLGETNHFFLYMAIGAVFQVGLVVLGMQLFRKRSR